MKKRFLRAVVAFAVLMAIAGFALRGRVLAAVLILLVGLLAKTLIAMKAGWREPDSHDPVSHDPD